MFELVILIIKTILVIGQEKTEPEIVNGKNRVIYSQLGRDIVN
jgi:hypothetical protein